MPSLIDTNVLVYRFDARYPEKQAVATETLRRGIEDDSVRLPHQAIVEFVAAVTRVKASDEVMQAVLQVGVDLIAFLFRIDVGKRIWKKDHADA